MMNPVDSHRFPRVYLAAVLWLFIVLAALTTFEAWKEYLRYPWTGALVDENTSAVIARKYLHPELYPRDYIYYDNRYTAFYIPLFTALTAHLSEWTGDYFIGLLLLQPPLMVIYLLCFWRFGWQLTGSWQMGVIIALLSLTGLHAMTDFWYVDRLSAILPRTAALPFVILAAWLFFRECAAPTRWGLFVSGVLAGLSANLHPPTGMQLALCLGLVAVAGWWRTALPGWRPIGLLVIGAFLGALPALASVFGNSAGGTGSGDFQAYLAAYQLRVTHIPLFQTRPFWRWTVLSPDMQIVVGLLWLPLSAALWVRQRRNSRSIAALLFCSLIMLFIWLLAYTVPTEIALLLMGYLGWRWWQGLESSAIELRLMELAAAIIFAMLCVPLLLQPVWLHFEIWSLGQFIHEFSRSGRLLALPVYGLVAVALWRIWQYGCDTARRTAKGEYPMPIEGSRLRRYYDAMVTLLKREPLRFIVLVGGSAAAMFVLMRAMVSVQFYVPIIAGAATGLVLWAWTAFRLNRDNFAAVLIVLLLILPVGLFIRGGYIFGPVIHSQFPLLCFVPIIFIGLYDRLKPGTSRAVYTLFFCLSTGGLALLLLLFSVRNLQDNRGRLDIMPPMIQAALWAQEHTPVDALFYFAHDRTREYDMVQFRMYSQRSVSHSFKDLSLPLYSRPGEFGPMVTRLNRIEAASGSAEAVMAMARELGATHILLTLDSSALPLELPEVYRNATFVIYAVAENP